MYKSKPNKITVDISMESIKARRKWSEVFWALNENNVSPRILHQQNYHLKLIEQ
jgi:hypothetical protein